MWEKFRQQWYLVFAHYFAFWARRVLGSWRPEIILVSGSSGKTTVFYLLKAQLGDRAEYAEHANSAFGIPFAILGLKRRTYSKWEWLKLFLQAPFCIGAAAGRKGIYVVEADAELPGEAEFIQKLLRPEYVILTNVFQTHAMWFDKLVHAGQYRRPLEAIGDEFVKYLRGARRRAIINADSKPLMAAIERANFDEKITKNFVYLRREDYLVDYKITSKSSQFVINGKMYALPYFLPRAVSFGLAAVQQVMTDLAQNLDESYSQYYLPPGRSTILAGVKNTTLIDSSYNANLGSMKAMLQSFEEYPAEKKWLVLGEFREQGDESQSQHEKLADYLLTMKTIDQLILVSGELSAWVYPRLVAEWGAARVHKFNDAGAAYGWLSEHIGGGETILIKGSQGRHLEGIVEGLLENKDDVSRLSCREAVFRPVQEKILSCRWQAKEQAPETQEE